MAGIWPLINFKEILSVYWTLSISKGNGEDPDPMYLTNQGMSSHIKFFNLVAFCNVLAEVVHTVFFGGDRFLWRKK